MLKIINLFKSVEITTILLPTTPANTYEVDCIHFRGPLSKLTSHAAAVRLPQYIVVKSPKKPPFGGLFCTAEAMFNNTSLPRFYFLLRTVF